MYIQRLCIYSNEKNFNKANTIILNIRKENLIDISNFADAIERLKISRKEFFKERDFKVVVIVRSIKKIKECINVYRRHGFMTTIYNSLLSKTEKRMAKERFEQNNNVAIIKTSGNLIGVDLTKLSSIVNNALLINTSDYYQDIRSLKRDGFISFALMYFTISFIISLKKIITIRNFESSFKKSLLVS